MLIEPLEISLLAQVQLVLSLFQSLPSIDSERIGRSARDNVAVDQGLDSDLQLVECGVLMVWRRLLGLLSLPVGIRVVFFLDLLPSFF